MSSNDIDYFDDNFATMDEIKICEYNKEMSYTITNYSKKRARELGVVIKKSKNKKKKIDVFKNNKKIASIGAMGYGDYPTFKKTKGKEFANKRRIAYKKRHQKNRVVKGSNGYYADRILW